MYKILWKEFGACFRLFPHFLGGSFHFDFLFIILAPAQADGVVLILGMRKAASLVGGAATVVLFGIVVVQGHPPLPRIVQGFLAKPHDKDGIDDKGQGCGTDDLRLGNVLAG